MRTNTTSPSPRVKTIRAAPAGSGSGGVYPTATAQLALAGAPALLMVVHGVSTLARSCLSGAGITDRCATKIGWCLESLLIPRSDFVARRIQKAIAGWGTDKMTLVRLLGGLDGRKLIGVLEAYETKYAKPLASSLNVEIGGHFANAALTWIRTLDDPSSGVEDVTEQSVSSFEGDAAALTRMCDFLLLENEMLMRFAASLDVETLAEAVRHNKTDDTRLIRTLTTRAKRFLGRLSYQYREENDTTLSNLVDENCEGW